MKRSILLLACAVAAAGCSGMSVRSPTAVASLEPTKGSQVHGTVRFIQKGDKVMVDATVTGLTPGQHGFHVHEKGNCTAPDGSSAGPHFNPGGTAHGGTSGTRHGGDLGNLTADASGTAKYKVEVTGISLGAGDDSIVGRAVIVHEKADDYTTQPSGGAGARLACGLISKSEDKWF